MIYTIVDGVVRPMTPDELAQIEVDKLAIQQANQSASTAPTRDELLAQLQSLQAQISALP